MQKRAPVMEVLAASSSPQLPGLDLGDKVPADATRTEMEILVSPAQLQPRWRRDYEGVAYELGVDRSGFVQVIWTGSDRLSTLEGVRVGRDWSDLRKIPGPRPGEWPGWGKVAELPSGCYAAAYSSEWNAPHRAEGPSGTVEMLFKGTAAGHGKRKPMPQSSPDRP